MIAAGTGLRGACDGPVFYQRVVMVVMGIATIQPFTKDILEYAFDLPPYNLDQRKGKGFLINYINNLEEAFGIIKTKVLRMNR